MPTWLWRLLALGLIALAFLYVGASLHEGRAHLEVGGISGDSHTSTHGIVVRSVRPGGEAARLGIKPNDVVEPQGHSFSDYIAFDAPSAGDVLAVRVVRGNSSRDVSLPVQRAMGKGNPTLYVVDNIVRFAMLIVALAVTLIRPNRRDARALVGFLVFFALSIYALPETLVSSYAQLILIIAGQILIFAALAEATVLATVFPVPNDGLGVRGTIARANPWVFGICAALIIVSFTIGETAGSLPPWLQDAFFATMILYSVMIATAFTIGIRNANGIERERGRWVALSLAVGCSGIVANIVLQIFGVTASWIGYTALTLIATPIGLAYGILRHRVLDIRFAVSRALALTILSATIVAAFGALEWAVGTFVSEAGHLTSAALQLGLAVVLGLSMNPLHRTIDRAVDDVLFRERHRAVRALSSFAYEATFFTDVASLLSTATALVSRSCHAPSAIYLADRRRTYVAMGKVPPGLPPAVDENDAAVVRLKAYREPAALRRLDTAVTADTVFPMIVRGTLAGFLALGHRDEEPLAPDEMSALSALTTSVGNVVDGLRTDDLRSLVGKTLDGELSQDELRARLRLLDPAR